MAEKALVMIPKRVRNVPDGDPEKVLNFVSEHQTQFVPHPVQYAKVGEKTAKSHILPREKVVFSSTNAAVYVPHNRIPDATMVSEKDKAASNASSIRLGEDTTGTGYKQRLVKSSFQLDFASPGSVKRVTRPRPPATNTTLLNWNDKQVSRYVGAERVQDYTTPVLSVNERQEASLQLARQLELASKTNVPQGDPRIMPSQSIARTSYTKQIPERAAGQQDSKQRNLRSSIVLGTGGPEYTQSSYIPEFPVYYHARRRERRKVADGSLKSTLKIQSELMGADMLGGFEGKCSTQKSHYQAPGAVRRVIGVGQKNTDDWAMFPVEQGLGGYSTTMGDSYQMREGLDAVPEMATGRANWRLSFGDDRIDNFH